MGTVPLLYENERKEWQLPVVNKQILFSHCNKRMKQLIYYMRSGQKTLLCHLTFLA